MRDLLAQHLQVRGGKLRARADPQFGVQPPGHLGVDAQRGGLPPGRRQDPHEPGGQPLIQRFPRRQRFQVPSDPVVLAGPDRGVRVVEHHGRPPASEFGDRRMSVEHANVF